MNNPDLVQRLQSIHRVMARGSFVIGEALARDALKRHPHSPEVKILLAQALDEQGNSSEGETLLREVLTAYPDSATINETLGLMLQLSGRFGEATPYLKRSLELNPRAAMSLFALARGQKVREEDRPLVEHMEALLREGQLPPFERQTLCYSLGKAREDLGLFREALEAFDESNRIALSLRQGPPFDIEAYRNSFRKEYFSKELFERNAGLGLYSRTPIFVVGMPRSGTTLVEQMISCHTEVGAAGELDYWLLKGKSLMEGEMAPQVQKLGKEYLAKLESIAPSATRVTDKMPGNFEILGYIQLVFPKATIIHVHRNPVANCLSLYTTSYRRAPEYAHSRKSIVAAFREYQSLMEHWNAVLPKGRIINVEYETLIEQPEPTIKTILEACGLDFQAECLDPSGNRGSIRTPSVWQARQPLYTSARERWKNFKPWLGEFATLRESAPSQDESTEYSERV